MRTLHMHAHAHTLLCCAGLWVSVHVCQLDRKEVWWRGLGSGLVPVLLFTNSVTLGQFPRSFTKCLPLGMLSGLR